MKPVNPEAVRRAWEQAADDLSIEVEFEPALIAGVVAIVRGFGRSPGTAVLAPQASASARQTAEDNGYFVSVVSASYEQYERELFIDTLNDWQWFGPGEPPEWYTGRPWSS